MSSCDVILVNRNLCPGEMYVENVNWGSEL
jgi:hypothetical protein